MSASILQPSETMDSSRVNANKNQSNEVSSGALSCPKCSSLILSAGLGKRVFMKRSLPELTLKADGGVNLQVLSEFVRVDDIYTFQNIGFSRNAGDVRYLLCADCEIGPLGIFEPKTELSFVAVERVVVG
ncbi:hypothetical protein M514_15201 [Trichuris suis]|uniref:Mss4 protein n=1 Tax=Trichuris suis TaxID=68888 RepID=A0A085NTK1_9BILA|nr:hypothetical protein M514_15201 [Trichuris suis]